MNWLDTLIAATVAFGALYGLGKGLVRLVFALVGVVVGIILAGQHHQALAQSLTFLPDPALANLVSYLVLFLAVVFIASAVGEVLHAAFGLMVFGCLDQVLGLVLGAAVAALVAQTILISVARFPVGSLQQALLESTLARPLLVTAPALLLLLPPDFREALKQFQNLAGPGGS